MSSRVGVPYVGGGLVDVMKRQESVRDDRDFLGWEVLLSRTTSGHPLK